MASLSTGSRQLTAGGARALHPADQLAALASRPAAREWYSQFAAAVQEVTPPGVAGAMKLLQSNPFAEEDRSGDTTGGTG